MFAPVDITAYQLLINFVLLRLLHYLTEFVEKIELFRKMFTLFYGLYKYLFKKDEYYVLILGLDNAGKTVSIYIGLVTLVINYTY